MWVCDHCGHTEYLEQEVICWECGKGEMIYVASKSATLRVAARHIQGGWINAVNGKFFNLRWDRNKWQLEEMADGSPIPMSTGLLDQSEMKAYQMPILDKLIRTKVGPNFNLSDSLVRSYAKLVGDDSGKEVRDKMVAAHWAILQDPDVREQGGSKLEAIMPEIRKKLVWKPVK